MAYALDNALYQWQEGERRLLEADGPEREELERAWGSVYWELRRRLGAGFLLAEQVEVYGEDLSWAEDAARRGSAVADLTTAIDTAFFRHARMASDWAGGRTHVREEGSF